MKMSTKYHKDLPDRDTNINILKQKTSKIEISTECYEISPDESTFNSQLFNH